MIGVFVGNGDFPKEILRSLKEKKIDHIIINLSDNFYKGSSKINLGKFGTILSILKSNKVKEVIFSGKIKRPSLSDLKFDLTSLRYIPELKTAFKKGKGCLLNFVNKILNEYNIKVVSSHKYSKELLLDKLVTKKKPTKIEFQDFNKAKSILKSLSKFDNAQGIILDNGYILSIEAAEGTDLMIQRTIKIKKKIINKKSGVLVKLPKKGQSLAYDLPTIGLQTIKLCLKANLSGIFLLKNKNIFLDREKSIKLADNNNLFITAI